MRGNLTRLWTFLRGGAARGLGMAGSAAKATPDGLRVLSDMLKSIRDIVVSAAVIGAVVFCVLIVVTQVRRAPPMLESIDLPQSLTAAGLTREGVTDRILAQIIVLRQRANDAMESSVPAPARSRHAIFGQHAAPAPAQGFTGDIGAIGRDGEKKSIVIPETGISIDAVSEYVKDMMGSDQLRFSGEIMAVDSCPGGQGKGQDKGFALQLREQQTGQLFMMPDCETGPQALDMIIDDAAMEIVSVTEPTVAEVLLFDPQRSKALSLARKVLTSDHPVYSGAVKARAHDILGMAAAADKNYAVAAGEFRQAIALDDSLGYLYNRNLCEALGSGGKTPLATALAYCDTALSGKHGRAGTHAAMGNIYLVHHKYDDAIASYERARADGGAPPGALVLIGWNLGLAYDARGFDEEDAGKFADARRDYTAAIRVNPADAESYEDLGSLELDQNNEPAARAAFETAARIAPANGDLLASIAIDLFAGPHPAEATPYFARAFAVDRAGALGHIALLTQRMTQEKKFDAVLAVLNAALKGDPGNAGLRRQIAQTRQMKAAAR